MRWSPLFAISTILAVTSIFEGVVSAPVGDEAARAAIKSGANILQNHVKVTLGPKGES